MLLGCILLLPNSLAQSDDTGDSADATEQPMTKGKKKKKNSSKGTKGKVDESQTNAVATAFNGFKNLGSPLNTKAEFYVYVRVDIQNEHCSELISEFVKDRKQMRKAGLEVIIINQDATETEAKSFLRKHHANFPMLCVTSDEAARLPGINKGDDLSGITFVKADGEVVYKKNHFILDDWSEIIGKEYADF